MKKTLKWIAIVFIALIVLALIFGGDDKVGVEQTSDIAQTTNSKPDEQNEQDSAEQEKNEMTAQQKNAVRSAKQYVGVMAFSKEGLVKQLSSDVGGGYSVEDATVAVESLNIDWNEQAEKAAKQYLDTQGFSCNALIKQLASSVGGGFTESQAEYGAKQAGACE